VCLIEQRGSGTLGELADIVHDLEPALGPAGGPPEPLEGGITNRNYRVQLGGVEYVLRLHGKDTQLLGISREAEALASSAAAGLGIAPEVAGSFAGGMVTRFVPCEALTSPEVAERAEEIARSLRRFHDSHISLPASFWVPDLLAYYEATLAAREAAPLSALGEARELAGRIATALPAVERRPCHNDLLPGNLIADTETGRVMIVDWEYAGMGDPWFDLANLSVNNEFSDDDDERLLAAYHGTPPSAAQRARLKLMRLMSDIREAAWGVVQGGLSDLDFDFAGYAERHFARMRGAARNGEVERWLAAAGGEG
jgi:thiamine kinase-like enzyme